MRCLNQFPPFLITKHLGKGTMRNEWWCVEVSDGKQEFITHACTHTRAQTFCLCSHVYGWMCVSRVRIKLGHHPSGDSTLFMRCLIILEFTILARVLGPWTPGIYLPRQHWSDEHIPSSPVLFWLWGLNSGPFACMASILPSELSPESPWPNISK